MAPRCPESARALREGDDSRARKPGFRNRAQRERCARPLDVTETPRSVMGTEVRHVSESIVCLRRASYLTCSYMVRTSAGLVLVDAGMDSNGADIQVGLKALQVSSQNIRAI